MIKHLKKIEKKKPAKSEDIAGSSRSAQSLVFVVQRSSRYAATAATTYPPILSMDKCPLMMAWYEAATATCTTVMRTNNVPTFCNEAPASMPLKDSRPRAPKKPASATIVQFAVGIANPLLWRANGNTPMKATALNMADETFPLKPLLFMKSGQMPKNTPAKTAFNCRSFISCLLSVGRFSKGKGLLATIPNYYSCRKDSIFHLSCQGQQKISIPAVFGQNLMNSMIKKFSFLLSPKTWFEPIVFPGSLAVLKSRGEAAPNSRGFSRRNAFGLIQKYCTIEEIASLKGSPRFARRLIRIEFSGQKRIGDFERRKENFLIINPTRI